MESIYLSFKTTTRLLRSFVKNYHSVNFYGQIITLKVTLPKFGKRG